LILKELYGLILRFADQSIAYRPLVSIVYEYKKGVEIRLPICVSCHVANSKQRQRAVAQLEGKLEEAQRHKAHLQEQADGFEAPKERADRDFRKQTIMTIRTLFLENLLQAFMAMLLSVLPKQVSLEQVLKLLFERSGCRIERDQTVMYGINATGLSRSNRHPAIPALSKDPIQPMSEGSLGAHFIPHWPRLMPPVQRGLKWGAIPSNF
jgi:hypothetical protein